MNRYVFIIFAISIVSIASTLLFLYGRSPLGRDVPRQNFDRKFVDEPVRLANAVFDLKFNSFYIAGITEKKIWLGNSTAPFLMVAMNRNLIDSQHVELKVKPDDKIDPRGFRLRVDSPFFFLMNGTAPAIVKGRLVQEKNEFSIKKGRFYFEEVVPIGSSSFVSRSYSKKSDGFELAKAQRDSFRFAYGLLEKQGDGAFSVDGQLHYDELSSQLVYLYHYRNQFVVADTNLNLRYRGNTIDTFSIARIKVATIESTGERMLAAPPFHTNAHSCVFAGYLYVKSNLLARNEDLLSFKEGSVIDVYDLEDGAYCYSFHIRNYGNYGLRDFRVWNDSLVTIFDHFLVLYSFGPAIMDQKMSRGLD